MNLSHVLGDLTVLCRLLDALEPHLPAEQQLGQLEEATQAYLVEQPAIGVPQLRNAVSYVARMIMLAQGQADDDARSFSADFSVTLIRQLTGDATAAGQARPRASVAKLRLLHASTYPS